jgi:hypothetical protein
LGRDELELAAICDGSLCRLRQTGAFALVFKRQSHFPGAQERFTNISVFRIAVERNQPIAMRTVGLKPVADSLGALAKYLRAFRAFDSDFFVDHEMLLNSEWQSAFQGLRACSRVR